MSPTRRLLCLCLSLSRRYVSRQRASEVACTILLVLHISGLFSFKMKMTMDLPPLLLPKQSLYQNGANIFLSLISIEVIHQIFRRRAVEVSRVTASKEQQLHYKTAVQLTHLAVNITLAVIGIYCWYGPVRPPRWEDCSLLDRWTGFQQYSFFGNIMISYNVWSSYASWVRYVSPSCLLFAYLTV